MLPRLSSGYSLVPPRVENSPCGRGCAGWCRFARTAGPVALREAPKGLAFRFLQGFETRVGLARLVAAALVSSANLNALWE